VSGDDGGSGKRTTIPPRPSRAPTATTPPRSMRPPTARPSADDHGRPPASRPPSNFPPISSRPPSAVSVPPPRRFSGMRLGTIDFELVNAARRIFEGALGLVPGEKVVVVLDTARKEMSAAMAEVVHNIGATIRILELEDYGPRPARRVPDEVEAAMHDAQASVLMVSLEDGEFSMRYDLVTLANQLNLRHVHMAGISRRSMLAGFTVDPARILDATRAVRTRLRPDSRLYLHTAAGSELHVLLSPSHRWIEQVGVVRPGRWENLPSGGLCTAPGDVEGIFVADASVGQGFGMAAGLLEKNPVRLEIEGGICKSVRCSDLALQRTIEDFMRRDRHMDRVGIVILGTNVGILAPIGEALCDQNLPGLHIAFGTTFPDQTGAVWTARSQLTFTCANADVDLDGTSLLRSGRYMVG